MTKAEYSYILNWAQKIKAIKSLGEKCEICGLNNIFLLEFHHKNRDEKEYKITDILDKRWSVTEREVKKCILLCRNCHEEKHCGSNSITALRGQKLKQKLMEYKGVVCCERCGYLGKNLGSLDFHHMDREQKNFKIMKEVNRRNKTLDYIMREVDKCEIICSNCHKKEHFDLDRFMRYKNNIYEKVDSYKEHKDIDKDMVLKLHKEGLRNVDIARKLNCAKSSITYLLKDTKIGVMLCYQRY